MKYKTEFDLCPALGQDYAIKFLAYSSLTLQIFVQKWSYNSRRKKGRKLIRGVGELGKQKHKYFNGLIKRRKTQH